MMLQTALRTFVSRTVNKYSRQKAFCGQKFEKLGYTKLNDLLTAATPQSL